jgi:hypothetical protein
MNELGISNVEDNKKLMALTRNFAKIVEIKYLEIDNDLLFTNEAIMSDLSVLIQISSILKKCKLFNSFAAIDEFIKLFSQNSLLNQDDIGNMEIFSKAYGRGQQYVSFIRSK